MTLIETGAVGTTIYSNNIKVVNNSISTSIATAATVPTSKCSGTTTPSVLHNQRLHNQATSASSKVQTPITNNLKTTAITTSNSSSTHKQTSTPSMQSVNPNPNSNPPTHPHPKRSTTHAQTAASNAAAAVPPTGASNTHNPTHKCDNPQRWIFSLDKLQENPSINKSFSTEEDRHFRQQAANMIQDMSKLLNIQPLATNTAIVYMHRFFAFHSFNHFDRFLVAACCVFLASKVEEQPRKLECVITVYCKCIKMTDPNAMKGEEQRKRIQDFILHEQLLVETLGFDVRVEHPHPHVIKITEKIKASKDLAQTSYLLATNTLHLTTFCLLYPPVVIACVCINLACKWGHWMIPKSSEKKEWWKYFAPSDFTQKKLDTLTDELVNIIDQSPAKMKDHLKRKCITPSKTSTPTTSTTSSTPGAQVPVKEEPKTPSPSSTRKAMPTSHGSPTKAATLKVTSSTCDAQSKHSVSLSQSDTTTAKSVKTELDIDEFETTKSNHSSLYSQSDINATGGEDSADGHSNKTVPSSVSGDVTNTSAVNSTIESKKKQLSYSQYKERLTTQRKLSEATPTAQSPNVKKESNCSEENKSSSLMTPTLQQQNHIKNSSNSLSSNTPIKEKKLSLNDTISPGTDAIANLLKSSLMKTESKSKLSIETNQSDEQVKSKTEMISPGAESIANLIKTSVSANETRANVHSLYKSRSMPTTKLSDIIRNDDFLSQPSSKVNSIKNEAANEVEDSSSAINNLLRAASICSEMASIGAPNYSILNSDDTKSLTGSHKHKKKEKKDHKHKSNKGEKKEKKQKHDRKRHKDDYDDSHDMELDEEVSPHVPKLKVRMNHPPPATGTGSPYDSHRHTADFPPPPPTLTPTSLTSFVAPPPPLPAVPAPVYEDTSIKPPLPPPPAEFTRTTTTINLPGSLGSLLESKRNEISSSGGEDDISSKRSHKEKRSKESKDKKKKKDRKHDRLDDEYQGGSLDEFDGHNGKHKKSKKKSKSKEATAAAYIEPTDNDLKIRIKLNRSESYTINTCNEPPNSSHSSYDVPAHTQSIENAAAMSLKRERDRTSTSSLHSSNISRSDNPPSFTDQPSAKKFKSLLADLPMPPPPPSDV